MGSLTPPEGADGFPVASGLGLNTELRSPPRLMWAPTHVLFGGQPSCVGVGSPSGAHPCKALPVLSGALVVPTPYGSSRKDGGFSWAPQQHRR